MTDKENLLNDFHSSEPRINQHISSQLSETSKWAKFLAIIGFIYLAIVSIAFFFIVVASGFSGITGGVGPAFAVSFVLLFVIALFFPTYFLFRFASNIQNGVETNSQDYMEKAFQNLKLTFRIVGIMVAVALGIFVLSLFASMF